MIQVGEEVGIEVARKNADVALDVVIENKPSRDSGLILATAAAPLLV